MTSARQIMKATWNVRLPKFSTLFQIFVLTLCAIVRLRRLASDPTNASANLGVRLDWIKHDWQGILLSYSGFRHTPLGCTVDPHRLAFHTNPNDQKIASPLDIVNEIEQCSIVGHLDVLPEIYHKLVALCERYLRFLNLYFGD